MEKILKYIVLFVLFLPLISTRYVPFFRKDYTYIEEFDAFYKVHWDSHGLSWNSAFLACIDEGATIYYPKVKNEWTLVKNLTNKMTPAPNVTDILIGLHDEFDVGEFITVDGHTTSSPLLLEDKDGIKFDSGSCVLMNIETGSYRVSSCTEEAGTSVPFVCRKVDSESCPTIDHGYKYLKSSKKCYKINKRQKSWDEAMRTCVMEGGLLTVIQNKAEADAIYGLLELYSTYHVGVRRIFSRDDYYTVKGQKLDDVYNEQRTNNGYAIELSDCGAIYVQNSIISTTTTQCNEPLPFICEMESI